MLLMPRTQKAFNENVKRLAEAGGQALLVTGPIVTSGQLTTTVTKEIITKIASIKNPEHIRNYINTAKRDVDNQLKLKLITQEQRNKIFDTLEHAEQSLDFKNLDGNADVTLAVKNYPSNSDTSSTYSPFTITSSTTKQDTRARGRYVNIKIANTGAEQTWRFGTLMLDARPDGGR